MNFKGGAVLTPANLKRNKHFPPRRPACPRTRGLPPPQARKSVAEFNISWWSWRRPRRAGGPGNGTRLAPRKKCLTYIPFKGGAVQTPANPKRSKQFPHGNFKGGAVLTPAKSQAQQTFSPLRPECPRTRGLPPPRRA